MPNARDVSRDFHAIGKAHPGDLTDGGVRFFGRGGRDFDANPALKWTAFRKWEGSSGEQIKPAVQSRGLGLIDRLGSSLAD